jgi:endoribonuclease LACTB2
MSPPFVVHPLRSDTLPPSTHTNCSVISGVWVVDPGSPDADEIDALVATLDLSRVRGIVLTHRHRDHIDGANLLRERLGVPIHAHAVTADEIAHKVKVDVHLSEGDTLPLPGGDEAHVLFTPGHARGHICLWHIRSQTMLVGDMVAGTGSILIALPDGDVADYLHSLERMRALAPRVLIPAHGPLIEDGVAKIAQYIAHRRAREGAILSCIQAHPSGVLLEDIVKVVYVGTPPLLLPWAAMSVNAHADKLARDGLVRRDKEDRIIPCNPQK